MTLEPGGQFELSGAPVETIQQTCAEVNNHLYQVRPGLGPAWWRHPAALALVCVVLAPALLSCAPARCSAMFQPAPAVRVGRPPASTTCACTPKPTCPPARPPTYDCADQVKSISEELGIGFLGTGFDPKWAVKDVPIMPKDRWACSGPLAHSAVWEPRRLAAGTARQQLCPVSWGGWGATHQLGGLMASVCVCV